MLAAIPVQRYVFGTSRRVLCQMITRYRRATDEDVWETVQFVAYAMGVTEDSILYQAAQAIQREYRELYVVRDAQRRWWEQSLEHTGG